MTTVFSPFDMRQEAELSELDLYKKHVSKVPRHGFYELGLKIIKILIGNTNLNL